MECLGCINLRKYMDSCKGEVTGRVVTDGKNRYYKQKYTISHPTDNFIKISSQKQDLIFPNTIPLTRSLISFFGLYSGDGSKGVEDKNDPTKIKPNISFSQREPNLVRFAVEQFKLLFGEQVEFNLSLGEDSAYFLDGEGLRLLKEKYGGEIPEVPDLNKVVEKLSDKDHEYLEEKRPNNFDNRELLAFYYFFKKDMEEILIERKRKEVKESGLILGPNDKITASMRRPFKKGARTAGGSSRSDETYLSGLNGFGELFLKIMHEIEQSIYDDSQFSMSGLIEWNGIPSAIGTEIDVVDFFKNNPYGSINKERPSFSKSGIELIGLWPRSNEVILNNKVRLDPLFCYVSGLYLAEGSTTKSELFAMYERRTKPMSLGFTSTENNSIELVLRTLKKMFRSENCLQYWKVKVGSQYFPELVVIGIKHGVPMMRGGKSGDGKLKTMEISLSIKNWALELAPCLMEYEDKYTHVEPTGAGIARIDFSASSSLCKWFFPMLMYTVFGETYEAPRW